MINWGDNVNVIVSNKQKGIIDNANIDAIKDLNGLFNVNDLINKFKNYFFSKMILDATSVIDFASSDVLKKLADEIGPDRLIILLPATPEPPDEFKKLLINLKIFNFSNKIEDIVKFIDKPNTYENAMNLMMNDNMQSNGMYVDNSIKKDESNDLANDLAIDDNQFDNQVSDNYDDNTNKVNDISEINDIGSNSISGGIHSSLGDMLSKLSFNDSQNYTSNTEKSVSVDDVYNHDNKEFNQTTEINEINNNSEINQINEITTNNDSESKLDTNYQSADNNNNVTNHKKTFLNMDSFDDYVNDSKTEEKRVIGFKNITLHAGSTTLIYMLQAAFKKNNKDILSIEINRNDFKLFRTSKMISIKDSDILDTINSNKETVILVDLNDCDNDDFCTDIIYLVEPSIIKLNGLMMENKQIFNELKNKKVILNKSLLSDEDISILESEADIKFFFNLNPVNDRNDNIEIDRLYHKLLDN